MMKRALIGLSLVALLGACGGGDTASTAPEADAPPAVTIEAIAFDPAEITVDIGDEVTWTNRDAEVKHTVTSGKPGDKGVPGLGEEKSDRPDGVFDGTLLTDGDTFAHTFDEAGRYSYFCRVHPVMTATVVVR